MATLTELKNARNAGLKLAKATQEFAQVDIVSRNKDDAEVKAELKAVADEAVSAATALGGSAAPVPDKALVTNGHVTTVTDANDAPAVPAVIEIANSAVTRVKLSAKTDAIVRNSDGMPVRNSANRNVTGTHPITIADGGVVFVRLASHVAPVVSGLHAVAATGTGTKVTLTVANGEVTAITLSA